MPALLLTIRLALLVVASLGVCPAPHVIAGASQFTDAKSSPYEPCSWTRPVAAYAPISCAAWGGVLRTWRTRENLSHVAARASRCMPCKPMHWRLQLPLSTTVLAAMVRSEKATRPFCLTTCSLTRASKSTAVASIPVRSEVQARAEPVTDSIDTRSGSTGGIGGGKD
eukprot:scaffold138611_cov33-Tisochrysis_lutea.AAC.6